MSIFYQIGLYYKELKEYEIMKIYFKMAIKKNISNAMCDLGFHYQLTEINYTKMMKYYLMAINQNNSNAMYKLGNYYKNIIKDYNLMKLL